MDVEQVIREYIDKSVHMSLGTSSNGKPWVCEVTFVYDDDLNIYWRSFAAARHSQELAANPQVAGNIVRQHSPDEVPHGIYFEGTAAQMTDEAERRAVFPLFHERLERDESILEDAKNPEGWQFYKLTVDTWYAFGKFDGPFPRKHELAWQGGKA